MDDLKGLIKTHIRSYNLSISRIEYDVDSDPSDEQAAKWIENLTTTRDQYQQILAILEQVEDAAK